MEQLSPFGTEEPKPVIGSDLPQGLAEAFPADAVMGRWPWQSDFLRLFDKYWAARRMQAWPRALRSLHEARCYAIAGEQWALESWLNDLIVEAIAKREARRR